MKIGILTFHREINYGACLQAYALLTHIKKIQNDTEIIDFVPNSEIDKRSWKRKTLHFFKTLVSFNEKKQQLKKKKFQSFYNKHLILSKEKLIGDNEARIANLQYQILISGSDQIFNLTLSDNSFTYYLPFNSITKISYGSSFGREKITDLEKWAILKYLPSFSNLSFREKNGYLIVNSLIKLKEENIVVDPVFLLSDFEWNLLIKKHIKKRKNYVFIYAMEKTKWLEKTIDLVSKKYPDYKLLLINGGNHKLNIKKKKKEIKIAGPEDFLALISEASIVVTNSFHGLAFALIFKKKIYCCAHSSKNTRLSNLLSMIGEDKKIIFENATKFEQIDGISALSKMEGYIHSSKNYLLKNLKVEKDD